MTCSDTLSVLYPVEQDEVDHNSPGTPVAQVPCKTAHHNQENNPDTVFTSSNLSLISILGHSWARWTPAAFSIMMYLAPTGFSFVLELQDSTLGAGVLSSFLAWSPC